MPRKDIAIFGAGGFGLEVAMLIEQINMDKHEWNLIGFFDDGVPAGKTVNEWQVLGGVNDLNAWSRPLAVAFALGIPKTKQAIVNKIDNSKLWFPTLVHPSAVMGFPKYVDIGHGSIVCAGSIITTNIHIGRFVIINLACTVGHETEIGDFCSFMPTCNISGEVIIGTASFWGTGAKVINRCTIGDHTTIGAGAVVINDLPSDVTAAGVPAKIIKSGA